MLKINLLLPFLFFLSVSADALKKIDQNLEQDLKNLQKKELSARLEKLRLERKVLKNSLYEQELKKAKRAKILAKLKAAKRAKRAKKRALLVLEILIHFVFFPFSIPIKMGFLGRPMFKLIKRLSVKTSSLFSKIIMFLAQILVSVISIFVSIIGKWFFLIILIVNVISEISNKIFGWIFGLENDWLLKKITKFGGFLNPFMYIKYCSIGYWIRRLKEGLQKRVSPFAIPPIKFTIKYFQFCKFYYGKLLKKILIFDCVYDFLQISKIVYRIDEIIFYLQNLLGLPINYNDVKEEVETPQIKPKKSKNGEQKISRSAQKMLEKFKKAQKKEEEESGQNSDVEQNKSKRDESTSLQNKNSLGLWNNPSEYFFKNPKFNPSNFNSEGVYLDLYLNKQLGLSKEGFYRDLIQDSIPYFNSDSDKESSKQAPDLFGAKGSDSEEEEESSDSDKEQEKESSKEAPDLFGAKGSDSEEEEESSDSDKEQENNIEVAFSNVNPKKEVNFEEKYENRALKIEKQIQESKDILFDKTKRMNKELQILQKKVPGFKEKCKDLNSINDFIQNNYDLILNWKGIWRQRVLELYAQKNQKNIYLRGLPKFFIHASTEKKIIEFVFFDSNLGHFADPVEGTFFCLSPDNRYIFIKNLKGELEVYDLFKFGGTSFFKLKSSFYNNLNFNRIAFPFSNIEEISISFFSPKEKLLRKKNKKRSQKELKFCLIDSFKKNYLFLKIGKTEIKNSNSNEFGVNLVDTFYDEMSNFIIFSNFGENSDYGCEFDLCILASMSEKNPNHQKLYLESSFVRTVSDFIGKEYITNVVFCEPRIDGKTQFGIREYYSKPKKSKSEIQYRGDILFFEEKFPILEEKYGKMVTWAEFEEKYENKDIYFPDFKSPSFLQPMNFFEKKNIYFSYNSINFYLDREFLKNLDPFFFAYKEIGLPFYIKQIIFQELERLGGLYFFRTKIYKSSTSLSGDYTEKKFFPLYEMKKLNLGLKKETKKFRKLLTKYCDRKKTTRGKECEIFAVLRQRSKYRKDFNYKGKYLKTNMPKKWRFLYDDDEFWSVSSKYSNLEIFEKEIEKIHEDESNIYYFQNDILIEM